MKVAPMIVTNVPLEPQAFEPPGLAPLQGSREI
jgi:hypothetical protein